MSSRPSLAAILESATVSSALHRFSVNFSWTVLAKLECCAQALPSSNSNSLFNLLNDDVIAVHRADWDTDNLSSVAFAVDESASKAPDIDYLSSLAFTVNEPASQTPSFPPTSAYHLLSYN